MSKLDGKVISDAKTGIVYGDAREVVESVKREEESRRRKFLYDKLDNNPEEMTRDEVFELRKLKKKSNKEPKIFIDFNIDKDRPEEYFLMKKNKNIVDKFDLQTKGALYIMSMSITHSGFLVYENNVGLKTFNDLKKLVGATDYVWKNTIWKEIKKHNIVIKQKIRGKWCLVMNPIFSVKNREITDYMFICFHKEIKEYLEPLDYLYLIHHHGIDPSK